MKLKKFYGVYPNKWNRIECTSNEKQTTPWFLFGSLEKDHLLVPPSTQFLNVETGKTYVFPQETKVVIGRMNTQPHAVNTRQQKHKVCELPFCTTILFYLPQHEMKEVTWGDSKFYRYLVANHFCLVRCLEGSVTEDIPSFDQLKTYPQWSSLKFLSLIL